jgi:hypothetical protein
MMLSTSSSQQCLKISLDLTKKSDFSGAALVNFSEDCPKLILTQYLDAIMGKLEAILSTKFKEVWRCSQCKNNINTNV